MAFHVGSEVGVLKQVKKQRKDAADLGRVDATAPAPTP